MQPEWIISACLGLGLSASCGFRVFVPLLVASVAAKLGLLPLTESFSWMSGWPAMICFGTATVVEVMAYYFPFIDNLLDILTTPLAILAGTLLATSVLPIDNNLLKWVTGIIMGGGSAGIIQSGTALLRLASSKGTAGTANPVLSTGEHVAALSTSVSAIFIPVVVAVIILALIVYVLVMLFVKTRNHTSDRSYQ
jgi:Domain of unknown function (DUF4126)